MSDDYHLSVSSQDMIDSSELAAGVEIERLMSELVDRLAACPCAVIDPRAWDQLRIYAPYGLRKRPVAFRYKDSVDGWVYTENESEAQQAFHNGHDTQGLYVRDGT